MAKATVCKIVIPQFDSGCRLQIFPLISGFLGRFFYMFLGAEQVLLVNGIDRDLLVLQYPMGLGAGMAKLVDARDLKSLGALLRAGSIPAPGTSQKTAPLNFSTNHH